MRVLCNQCAHVGRPQVVPDAGNHRATCGRSVHGPILDGMSVLPDPRRHASRIALVRTPLQIDCRRYDVRSWRSAPYRYL